MKELIKIYQQCFPDKNAEAQVKALGENFEYKIKNGSFIIYMTVSPDEVEIIDIGTSPELRRQSGATNLLQEVFLLLQQKDIKNIYLEVAENNTPALALYIKNGFEKYSLRKNYYNIDGKGVNAVLMKKSFDFKA